MIALNLFTTSGCHLCDEAKALLASLQQHNIQFEEIEIAESDALIERYGTRIPVLKDKVSGVELNWPFNAERLNGWLDEAWKRE